MNKKINKLFNEVIKMNVGFYDDTKQLYMFNDEENGASVANLGFKLTKEKCDGCEECIISNPYEDYIIDCPYGVDDDLRLTY